MKVKSSVVAAATAAVLAASVAGAVESEAEPVLEHGEFAGRVSHIGHAGVDDDSGTNYYRYQVREMSDPRLDGEMMLATRSEWLDDYGRTLWHASFRIETEEGAWQEPPRMTLERRDGTGTTNTSALVGEGAYEGLTALVEMTYQPPGVFEMRGVITEDPVPPLPVWTEDHPE